MLKRLTAFLLVLICLCPAAQAAGRHSIHLTKAQEAGRDAAQWFASDEDKAALIALVADQFRGDSAFRKRYSGFKVDDALNNACMGAADGGGLFVAMLNEKTGVMLAVTFDGQTYDGTYTVTSNSREAFRAYQFRAASAWSDPTTPLNTPEDLYRLADAELTIGDPALVRRFHEELSVQGGQPWDRSVSSMATLALVMHYQLRRSGSLEPQLASFDGANALETCYFLKRDAEPDRIALAFLDDESGMLLISDWDMAQMTVDCRLFRDVQLTHLPRLTSLYDMAQLIPQRDMLTAMVDVNVMLADEE